MNCNNCGNNLPDESDFCPYCMTKFFEPPASKPISSEKSSNKKRTIIIIMGIIAVVISVAVVSVIMFGQKGSEKKSTKSSGTKEKISDSVEQTISSSEEEQTSSTIDTTNPSDNSSANDSQPVNKDLMIDAYASLIFEKLNTADIFELDFAYTVYDLNSDGIYEVIINLGDTTNYNSEYCYTEVYTFLNNRVVSAGKFINDCYPSYEFYLAKDGGVLLTCYSDYVAQIKMEGNKAVYKVLSKGNYDFEINDHAVEMMPQAWDMTYNNEYKTLAEEVINKGYNSVATQFLKDYADSCD